MSLCSFFYRAYSSINGRRASSTSYLVRTLHGLFTNYTCIHVTQLTLWLLSILTRFSLLLLCCVQTGLCGMTRSQEARETIALTTAPLSSTSTPSPAYAHCSHTLTLSHSHTHTHSHSHTHTLSHSHTHILTHTHSHTQILTLTHSHTHTLTHTHTHSHIPS